MPMLNILNGGKHADGSTDIQEFMVMPVGAADLQTALRMASEIYHTLGKLLKEKGYEVLLLADPVDEWVTESLREYKEKKLQSVTKEDLNLDSEEEKKYYFLDMNKKIYIY